ncbi:MAG: phosphatidylserine/phosphatidylglycerophosphate/cardiolipin synthase family protein [Phycisphaerae bacterium]
MPQVDRQADGRVQLVANAAHHARVVEQGICRAKRSIEIMTADFKAMLVPAAGRGKGIVDVLRKQARDGVEVRLLHAGVPSSAALRDLLAAMPKNLQIRRCPRLHAKAVIIDCRQMYLGSANLTGAGLGAKGVTRRNFELGVWTEAPELIDAVLDEFNALWEGHHCQTCGRRNVCPEPLEEPHLLA